MGRLSNARGGAEGRASLGVREAEHKQIQKEGKESFSTKSEWEKEAQIRKASLKEEA